MPARCSEVRLKRNIKPPVVPGLSSSLAQGREKLSRCQADSRYCQQEEIKKFLKILKKSCDFCSCSLCKIGTWREAEVSSIIIQVSDSVVTITARLNGRC